MKTRVDSNDLWGSAPDKLPKKEHINFERKVM